MKKKKDLAMHGMPGWEPVSEPECVSHRVSIAGRVIDAETKAPIAGAIVKIEKRPEQTQTAADGHFHFLDLPDGTYELSASAGGREGSTEVTLKKGKTTQEDILIEPTQQEAPGTKRGAPKKPKKKPRRRK